MATLREIQLAELTMFKYLHSVCSEYNLKYSMIGGTMLGAIRHKGFIPWDDDIDIYMPLGDARKLRDLCHNEAVFFQNPETEIESPFLMYKLRKNETCMVEPGTEHLNIHQGIWIDIFPYVYAANSSFGIKMQVFFRAVLQTYRCRYRYVNKGHRRIAHYLLTKMPKHIQLMIDSFLENIIDYLGNKKSDKYFAIDVSNNTIHSRDYFDHLALYDFEGFRFWGVKDYDRYLKQCYGDNYMIPKQWNHIRMKKMA